ncbi:MAG TPA: sigma-70 family RNA polymerase sigma factor [Candidatus Omnitrophota bacterium]|jgi:RNA polymerase sigma factor (TIGR02999 family)|nr:sigma-70 family RNA polymerase sigma factor [Candidatus Omnitrophota bacterium]
MDVPGGQGAPSPSEVTQTFLRWRQGDASALHALLPLVYEEMRRLAGAYLRDESAGHTLQPTALAHEAYLRLLDQRHVSWQNRAHFMGLAAQAMRRILIDHARRRGAQKRGGDAVHVTLEDSDAIAAGDEPLGVAAEDLNDALDRLAALDERQARVVELRFFTGLSVEETAEVLGVSPATVKRDWTLARAWLHRELKGRIA